MATRIIRELDSNEQAQKRAQREQDGSEVRSVELETLIAEGITLIERRNAFVRRTLDDLVPILIAAPADEKTRAKWLEQLRAAIEDDGVDYLAPISERFGEIAAYPALMTLHADRDLALIHRAWSDWERYSHVGTATLTLSCLLEAGRYDELLALLAVKKTRLWFDDKFGAEALLRQDREDDALAYAEALLEGGSPDMGPPRHLPV